MGFSSHYRDAKGECLAMSMHNTKGSDDPILVEAMTIATTCEIATKCCFRVVVFKTDNQTIANVFHNKRFVELVEVLCVERL